MKNDELAALWDGLKRALSAAADLILLNFLLILCCVPVVTAGAAWVSAYAYVLRLLRGEEQGFVFRPFFADFRKGFRKSTGTWLIMLVCFAILAGDYDYAAYVSSPVNRFFLIFSIVMAVVILLAAVWLFPLMARFENTLKAHIKNAFLMAVAELPRTILALVIWILFLALPFLILDLFVYLGWIWVLFGFSLPMYLTARIFRKRLDCAPPKQSADGQD